MGRNYHVDRIFGSAEHRERIRAIFEAEGFTFTAARERKKHGFYAHLKWRGRAANPLGTPLETLLFVVEGAETQYRDLQEVEQIIDSSDGRLNPLVAIVFGPSINTPDVCGVASEQSTTHFVGASLKEIYDRSDSEAGAILNWIRASLYDQDIYAKSGAVYASRDFFGRRSDVTRLAGALRGGSSHFGLFGLRKVGKTSLLLRVLNVLKNEGKSGQVVAHVDVEYADGVNPTTDYLLWQIGESLHASNKTVRRVSDDLDLFGRFSAFYRIPNGLPVREAFAHDLKAVIDRAQNKTIIIGLDEIQFMLGENWGGSYVQCWRLLRALDQENPGSLSFVVSGTNPASVEAGHVDGAENPTFRYITRFPVAPFDLDESQSLLAGIGVRMGLEWYPEAFKVAYRVTGGHPGLLREFGSRVHSELAPRSTSIPVDSKLAESVARKFLSASETILQEMDDHLKGFHPDQHVVIECLADNALFEWEEYKRAFPEAIAVLQEYGLIGSNAQGHDEIMIGAYKAWLQAKGWRDQSSQLPDSIRELQAGDVIGGWRLVRPLGSPGGYGRVFEAINSTGRRVALKVLVGTSSLRLRREVEALARCDHPAIVHFISSGESQGFCYLAMELLEGHPWTEHCSAIGKLSERGVLEGAVQLLGSLESMHPRDLSDDDTQDLAEIVASRRGLIHRDIKPDNVIFVPGRGPVLIDFNISSEAKVPVGTVSVTPGYLPPDLAYGGSWDPSVDLYMLGLTLAQILVGVQLAQGRVEDLKEAVRRDSPPKVADFILRLCADSAPARFENATEARAAAEALVASL